MWPLQCHCCLLILFPSQMIERSGYYFNWFFLSVHRGWYFWLLLNASYYPQFGDELILLTQPLGGSLCRSPLVQSWSGSVMSSVPHGNNTALCVLFCSGYQLCKKMIIFTVLLGFPHKGYMVWVGRLCWSVYLERVNDLRHVRPCCVPGFLSGNTFRLNSKERREVCVRAKCMIHIIGVKLGASFHHAWE